LLNFHPVSLTDINNGSKFLSSHLIISDVSSYVFSSQHQKKPPPIDGS
jgi:hypothetical protein